ncbi:MAG: hypothetical protein QUS13_13135 [Smithella sp.]|nr:hypothetical protein [Smithella sp.]
MFIHIGNNIIISDKKLMGIFNIKTLAMSNDNEWIVKQVDNNGKTIAIDRKSNVVSSNVSPFTVIKRTALDEDCFWRRSNDKELQR